MIGFAAARFNRKSDRLLLDDLYVQQTSSAEIEKQVIGDCYFQGVCEKVLRVFVVFL